MTAAGALWLHDQGKRNRFDDSILGIPETAMSMALTTTGFSMTRALAQMAFGVTPPPLRFFIPAVAAALVFGTALHAWHATRRRRGDGERSASTAHSTPSLLANAGSTGAAPTGLEGGQSVLNPTENVAAETPMLQANRGGAPAMMGPVTDAPSLAEVSMEEISLR